jgi:hypothetical protein
MKRTHAHRYRSPARFTAPGLFFKRSVGQHSSSAGESATQAFFQPTAVRDGAIHRKCEACEKEENDVQHNTENKVQNVQRLSAGDKKEEKKISRQPEKKEEEKLIQKKEGNTQAAAGMAVNNYVSTLTGKGQPLPQAANHFFSSRMGADFSGVKLHSDKDAAASAKALNAKAYTISNHIVFSEGQYNTESTEGKKLLAHELTHVMQQDKAIDGVQPGEVQRKVIYSRPSYSKEDPIPKSLRVGGGRLGETYITLNGQKLLTKLDAMKAVFEAFNKNLTLKYDTVTKTCKVNTADILLDISAAITLVTDPVNDKWSGSYAGSLVAGSYTCSKLPTVNVEMVSKPSGGEALQKSISNDEAQHFSDVIDVSEKHIEPFHKYLENLSLASENAADCGAKFNAAVGTKDIDMAKAFTEDWLKAVDKHDNPATGAHHYKSVTDARNCNLVKITVSF